MPEISRFYGIVIKIYFDDHWPSHFHAQYGAQETLLAIDTLAVIAGRLPPRAFGMIMEWASLHQEELREAWNRAKNLQPPGKIDPLP
ncbi:MAG: DUF4160 domain-containing protein [Acidobacteria bacterium]|nr:DUF4160 domain-containing protein [Acidobacteriota bacterium]